ncbi:hypothetical protein ABPG77_008685 [Micractinium sp. CCAP 211/92]
MLRLVHQAIARRLQRLPPAAAAGWAPFSSGAEAADLAFRYVRHNGRPTKPRTKGLTEIRPARLRGPYYTPVTPTYLRELLEGVGHAVDGLKYAGGAFSVLSAQSVRALNDTAHQHGVYVSTGGWVEHVLGQGQDVAQRYLTECRELGFDVVELSTGFISLPTDDLVRLVKDVQQAGLRPKPEVGIQFGAGGDSSPAELRAEGTIDVSWAIHRAQRCLQAGAPLVMIESEGITEDVDSWRTDVVSRLVDALGTEQLMFEAAGTFGHAQLAVPGGYVKTFGADVYLFVDHSQIVQLECLRRGVWGTKGTWGRIATYGEAEKSGSN